MARYTGTFLSGPYDGEIAAYDYDVIVREDPIDTDLYALGLEALATVSPITEIRQRAYRWTRDDDARGWWLPIGYGGH